jgi:hypothetical protein
MTSPSPEHMGGRSRARQLVAAALLSGALLTGCKQGVGERCEITSDCQSGLECSGTITSAGSAVHNSVCKTPGSVSTLPDAAAIDAPLRTADAAADAPADAALPDAAVDRAADVSPDVAADVAAPLDATAGS